MRYRTILVGIGLAWAQGSCPYVRYILYDACGSSEGNDELLIFWSGPGFNTDQLRIYFPNPDATLWCNSTCGGNTLNQCNNALINDWNTTCGATVFQCVGSNYNIPPNSWVILFTGYQNTTPYPNPTNLCGAGTVYVMFANNTNGAGRYLNNPTDGQNRRTAISFTGMPACSMTVNYRNIQPSSVVRNGNYLVIDPNICIGRTEGQNNVAPSSNACYFQSATNRNGVDTGNVGTNCPLPGPGILPILWAYTHIEGSTLVWHATGLGGDEGARLTLEYAPHAGGEWAVIATGLPLIGRYPLERSGFYRLAAPLRGGEVEYSPVVEFRAEPLPTLYPNPAPGGPYLSYPELVYQIEVLDMRGALVYRIAAPVAEDALRGLPSGLYLVRLFTVQGERAQRLLVP
ncbi:MAG: T9SS type A sorting domain-containing protein [Bacteroidia bacterium]|nr:T9SS type A sorting domain-containing protein [Bacteroidia bacterium]